MHLVKQIVNISMVFNRKSMGIEIDLLLGASGVDAFDDVAMVLG